MRNTTKIYSLFWVYSKSKKNRCPAAAANVKNKLEPARIALFTAIWELRKHYRVEFEVKVPERFESEYKEAMGQVLPEGVVDSKVGNMAPAELNVETIKLTTRELRDKVEKTLKRCDVALVGEDAAYSTASGTSEKGPKFWAADQGLKKTWIYGGQSWCILASTPTDN